VPLKLYQIQDFPEIGIADPLLRLQVLLFICGEFTEKPRFIRRSLYGLIPRRSAAAEIEVYLKDE
jgi:hypothetical protein